MKQKAHVRKLNKAIALLALLLAVVMILPGCNEKEKQPEPKKSAIEIVLEKDGEWRDSYEAFLRLDLDSATAWQEELEAVRIITKGKYEFVEAKEKYNLDPDFEFSTEGLNSLSISGSAQFSAIQFEKLAEDLREAAGGRKIVIVDLREESHYFINGISVSLFSLHNWANLGMSLEEVTKAEEELFTAMMGQTVTAYARDDESKLEECIEFKVEHLMSEKELVESQNFEYLRIPCTDHAWPTPEEIDFFIDYVKKADTEDTWFHFHCLAGKGRTGVYMMLYDKMMNPQVPMKDILYRQAKLYSNYPLYLGDGDDYKGPLYAEKAEMTPLLFQYIEENHQDNYEVSWSEWLKKQ